MPTNQLTTAGAIAGIAMRSNINRTAEGQIGHEITLAAAKSGTLSTRTTDTTGTLTISGHGWSNGDVIDVYWNGGRRYDVDVGVVAGDDVPISGGSGDVLPAQGTAITAAEQQVIDTDFDGDLVSLMGALADVEAHLGFYDTGPLLALSIDLAANEIWYWDSAGNYTNPIAGDTIGHVVATQSGTTAKTLKLGILYDSGS